MINKKYMWVLFFLGVIFLVSYNNIDLKNDVDIRRINVHLEISNRSEIIQEESDLYLYVGSGRRVSGVMFVSNDESSRKNIGLNVVGELGNLGWFSFREDEFYLSAEDSREVVFDLVVPPNVDGNFSGVIIISHN